MDFNRLKIRLYLGIFQSICEEMGTILERTGYSPNIKERRDFSCALFDAKGEMIAQAAHIPVHLGSAGRSVQAAIKKFKMQPGDMVILNDPYQGGTHLPDLTVIAPVFDPTDGRSKHASFFVANRAHHADIGGLTPGSLPLAKDINEEGICLGPTLLVKDHKTDSEVLKTITHCSRTPKERHGDLLAQVSANKLGQHRTREAIRRYGHKALRQKGHELQAYSELMMTKEIQRIPNGRYSFEDYLESPETDPQEKNIEENLIRLHVQIIKEGKNVTIDFSKTSSQHPSSLNTVLAVTEAAVLYVFRSLATEDFPVNAGCFKPLKIIAPEGCLLNAQYPAAVSAGNVETSQRIVDLLLGALSKALPDQIPAASCGSMNNICIGGNYPMSNQMYSYYETIAGGQGATPWKNGANAHQTHMTNTLNTPIEALEHAFPFRIHSYRIRENSGGNGKFKGGNGLERSYLLLEEAKVTVISERRIFPPYGLDGGEDGLTGENSLFRNEKMEILPGKFSLDGKPGDIIRILTPGGGGFGRKA